MGSKMIKLIGTHHLMKEEDIRKEIELFNPEIVLVELCNGRIYLIEHPEQQNKKFSLLGLIANAIRKKVSKEGLTYGNDMISAYKIAKEKGINIGLIDRPMVETQVLFKAIPLKEKWYMLKQLMKFNSNKIKTSDIINEVNDANVQDILNKFSKECPNLFYYLVSSRDEYMINKIKAILFDNPNKKILGFVGKGHLKFLEDNIKHD